MLLGSVAIVDEVREASSAPPAKSIIASVCPAPVSSWLKAILVPSGENAGVPPLVMTPSQPGAGMMVPVLVS